MVGTTTCRVYKATRDARHEQIIVNLQLDDVIQLLLALFKHLVQLLCLRHGSREAVEDKAAATQIS